MTDNNLTLKEEVSHLAQELFGNIKARERRRFVSRLWDTYTRAQGKDFLLIHSPGGWGCTTLEHLLDWERSVVDGVSATLEQLGFSSLLIQYFRSGTTWWQHVKEVPKEARYFLAGKSAVAGVMAAELRFIRQHIKNLRVILVGASQGAAFNNTVMRQTDDLTQVYSVELGLFFPHMSRRVITERTLAIDSNGRMSDPMCNRNLWVGFMAYMTSPFRWIKYQLQGKPQKLTYCINAKGHDYSWDYPEVRERIMDFLTTNFGGKSKLGGGES